MVPTGKTITLPDPAKEALNKRIEKAGTQKAAAGDLGISPSLLTEILKDRRSISPTLLDKLDVDEITVRTKRSDTAKVVRAIRNVIGAQQ